MIDPKEIARYQKLRQAAARALSVEELSELDRLTQEVEYLEAQLLADSKVRLTSDIHSIESRNDAVREVLQKQARMISKLELVLNQSLLEKVNIDKQLAKIGVSIPSSTSYS